MKPSDCCPEKNLYINEELEELEEHILFEEGVRFIAPDCPEGLFVHNPLRVIRKDENAKIPTKAHSSDCCYDLYSVDAAVLKPLERKLIDTGVVIQMPGYIEGQIRPRSGLAYKHGITVLNSPGTIDSGFLNTWKVLLINLSNEDYEVKVGDRVAQVKFSAVCHTTFEEVEEVNETDRGETGFGDSGR